MTNTNEELNLDEITSDVIKNELIRVVKSRLLSDNIKISIEHGSKKGDNFVGAIYRILYKDASDISGSSLSSLILKMAPSNLMRREALKLRELFAREMYIYDEERQVFHDFQQSKGVNPRLQNGFNEYPLCYSSISAEYSECLFFEDLGLRSFEVINHRTEPITFDHMELVMNALGKFHAVSLALKDQEPNKFKDISGCVTEQYWSILETQLKRHYSQMLDRFLHCLKESNRIDLFEKLQNAIGDNYFATIRKITSSDAAEPYTVVCHGDLTIYNSMFRKNEDGKPIEIQLIDWQFPRYASPVTDLVLYLFCSTSKGLRDQYFDVFLKIYHGSLSEMLRRLGADPQKIFPFEVLLEQLRKFGLYAVLVGSVLLPILCAEIDSIPGFEKALQNENNEFAVSDDDFRIPDNSKEAYYKRIADMIDDLVANGCI